MRRGTWQNPKMTQKWTNRALARMKRMGLTVADVNRAISKSSTLMTDTLKKGTSPSVDNFAKVAKLLGMSVGELYDGDGIAPQNLTISGIVRGHEMWSAVTKAEKKEASLSFFDKDLVILQIETYELQPAYRFGDVIAGPKMLSRNLDNIIGRDCICEAADGTKYVKELTRGTKAGTFTLRSLIRGVKDIENVKLEWAAPVEMIVRPLS